MFLLIVLLIINTYKSELIGLIPVIYSISVRFIELLSELFNSIQGMFNTTYGIISTINPYDLGKSLGVLVRPYAF